MSWEDVLVDIVIVLSDEHLSGFGRRRSIENKVNPLDLQNPPP